MADVGTLIMKVEADTKKFHSGIKSVGDTLGKIAKTTAIATAAIGAGLVVAGKKALDLGADAEEMRNKYDVVFSDMTGAVDDWTNTFAKSMGRSKFDIQESISNLADLQQGLGMTKQESFDLSKKVIELSTDLASFNNVNDSAAVEAVSKAMLGEAESAKSLGLLLNVERVKAFAEEQGLVYKNLTDSEKAMQVYKLAVTQSQNAIGDAERSSGSYTNQMKRLKSGLKDITTEFGMKLIPVASQVVTWFNNHLTPAFEAVSKWWEENSGTIKTKASEVFGKVKEYAGIVVQFYNNHLVPVFQKVSDWWSNNKETIKTMASDAFDGIKKAAEKAWTFFEKTLLPIFEDVATYIIDNYPAMQETAEKVFAAVKVSVEAVSDLFEKHMLPALEDLADDAKKYFPIFLEEVTKAFGDAAIIIQGVTDAIDYVLDGIKKIKEATGIETVQELMDPIGAIKGSFRTPAEKAGFAPFQLDENGKALTPFQDKWDAKRDAKPRNVKSGQRANGGTVNVGESYLVGEKGQETFTPNADGVVSNGGGITINITGNTIMNDRMIDTIGNAMIRKLKLSGVRA